MADTTKEQKPMGRDRYSRAMSLSVDWDHVISGMKRKLSVHREISAIFEKPPVEFCTNSVYSGQWNTLGMAGFGTYVLPHGVEYEGSIKDGMFHGEGTLSYPMGQKIDGKWNKGRLISCKFRFVDGLEYDTPWQYCQMPDRRFWTSIQEGLRPGGKELLTNVNPPREIPEGCYDTGDGFYNPKTKCVTSPTNPRRVLRIPTASEEMWIMANCRRAWTENTGYKPCLYEHWVSGRRAEMEELEQQCASDSQDSEERNLALAGEESYDFLVTTGRRTSDGFEGSSATNICWKEEI